MKNSSIIKKVVLNVRGKKQKLRTYLKRRITFYFPLILSFFVETLEEEKIVRKSKQNNTGAEEKPS